MKKTRERDKFNSPKLCNYLKPNLHAPSIRKGGGAFFLNFEKTVLPSPTHNSEACLHYYPPTLIRQHLGISFLRILWLFLYFYDCRDFGYTYPPPFKNHATFLTCTNLFFSPVYWVHVLCLAILIPINISTLDCRNVVRCGIVSCDICIKRKRRAVCNLVYGHDQTIAECTKNNCNTLYRNIEFFLLLSFRWWIWYSN